MMDMGPWSLAYIDPGLFTSFVGVDLNPFRFAA